MAGRHARPTRAQARRGANALHRQPVSARVAAARRARLGKQAKNASVGTSVLAGALILGLVGGGGTFALWNDVATIDAGTIQGVSDSGEVSLRFAVGDPAAASANFSNMLPGESMTIPVQLQNDGDFDLSLSANLTSTTGSGYALRLKMDEACTTSGFLSSQYVTGPALVIATPAGIGSIAEGTTKKLCVQVTADPDIVPTSAMTFDVTISGDSGS